MKLNKTPVYMIGVAAELCGVHPQTLRQYERLGLLIPARVGAKNRLYSEEDIMRVRRIQRLTQDMGVNLAGVEIILKLQEAMEDMEREFEEEFRRLVMEMEERMRAIQANPNAPIPFNAAYPVPRLPRRSPLDE
ncbi:MAG: heat shock protein transcriptional repressor HspR [Fimbriimonadaceae bacterium]